MSLFRDYVCGHCNAPFRGYKNCSKCPACGHRALKRVPTEMDRHVNDAVALMECRDVLRHVATDERYPCVCGAYPYREEPCPKCAAKKLV